MENIAVFAHFDKDNLIDDYVIYYLNHIRDIADKIIFVSDSSLSSEELSKISAIADDIVCEKHGEYDFGSYKRGFNLALEKGYLINADNLIFLNDSCYGPFYSLSSYFEKMQNASVDFWGLTCNKNVLQGVEFPCPETKNTHLQTYFIVFRNNVFNSEIFKNFINSIEKKDNKFFVIADYEIGLTALLAKAGYKFFSFEKTQIGVKNKNDIFKSYNNKPFVFLKTSVLRRRPYAFVYRSWLNNIKKYSSYPTSVILNNLVRTKESVTEPVVKLFLKKLSGFFMREREAV